MGDYSEAAWERAMKVQEVILRALARQITWVAGGRDPGDLRTERKASWAVLE